MANIKFTLDDRLNIKFGDDTAFSQKSQMINAIISANGPNIKGTIDVSNPKEVHFRWVTIPEKSGMVFFYILL